MKSMTSYAQNFEDVMLTRALSGVDVGFYIDVGAQDPVVDSVTRAFYVRGWRGINIDPVKHWHQRLMEDRPHDINLRVAVGATQGQIRVHEVADSGLSTISDQYAARHEEAGFAVSSEMVEMTTLDSIMAEQRVTEVHFLKVDVEGAEKDVLTGISFREVRPWVVLVESREPNSRVTTHDAWEHLLLDAQYTFVYDDGLNRFYVANEHAELFSSFELPPNVFDNFTSWSDPSAEVALALCKEGARLTQARLEEVDAERASLAQSLAAVRSDRDGLAKWAGELEAQAVQSKSQLESLLERAVRMECKAAALDARLAEVMEAEVACSAELRRERDELAGKLDSIKADREGLVKWVGQLQADSRSHAERIEELLKQLVRAEAARDALADNFQAAVARGIESGLREVGEERDRLQRLHLSEVARVREIEEQLDRAEEKNAMLEAVSASLAAANAESAALRAEARVLSQRLSVAESGVAAAEARERDLSRFTVSLQTQLDTVLGSRSWRITSPLRAIARMIRGARAQTDQPVSLPSVASSHIESRTGEDEPSVGTPDDALRGKHVASLQRLSGLVRRKSK